jgi:delta14-sterol reductase
MASKKDSKAAVRLQPVPEKRGYEFFGPYVALYSTCKN